MGPMEHWSPSSWTWVPSGTSSLFLFLIFFSLI
jgi:hypothetical protein